LNSKKRPRNKTMHDQSAGLHAADLRGRLVGGDRPMANFRNESGRKRKVYEGLILFLGDGFPLVSRPKNLNLEKKGD